MQYSTLALVVGVPLTIVALSVAGLRVQSQVEIGWTEPKPIVAWVGSYSAIEQRHYRRIINAKDWTTLWTEHQSDRIERDSYGEPVVPTIDFETNIVLAIFRGKAWNVRAESLVDFRELENNIRIRFDARTYQTDGPAEDKDYTSAYGIWVLPRLTKSITLIENVQGFIGQPPKWKTQHTFDPLREN